jgi:hypothetical protein
MGLYVNTGITFTASKCTSWATLGILLWGCVKARTMNTQECPDSLNCAWPPRTALVFISVTFLSFVNVSSRQSEISFSLLLFLVSADPQLEQYAISWAETSRSMHYKFVTFILRLVFTFSCSSHFLNHEVFQVYRCEVSFIYLGFMERCLGAADCCASNGRIAS